jgi:hypothetical protein
MTGHYHLTLSSVYPVEEEKVFMVRCDHECQVCPMPRLWQTRRGKFL